MTRVFGILLTVLALPLAGVGLVLILGGLASLAITLWVGSTYPPRGPFVEIAGGRLATIQDGPLDGPPIVLLHGASANASDPMEGVGRLLAARGFRVIAFDRPGFGWSDRIAGAEAAAPAVQARLIAEALRRMGIGPAIVFGHSWAGALALALALDHPDRVSALALAAPVAMPMPDQMPALPWYWRLAVKPPVAWLLSRTAGPPLAQHFLPEAARRVFQPQPAMPDYAERARAALVLRPGHPARQRAGPAGIAGGAGGPEPPLCRDPGSDARSSPAKPTPSCAAPRRPCRWRGRSRMRASSCSRGSATCSSTSPAGPGVLPRRWRPPPR